MSKRAFLHSIWLAITGLDFAVQTQRNLRWHVVAACAVILAAAAFGLGRIEVALLVLVIGIVLCAEVLNTAVELTIDLLKAWEHPVAKVVKDVSAGAVLVTVLMAIVIGFLLFGPHLETVWGCFRP
ncbi:MAG: diacylglycerol kinase family protein [Candidatus Omnitrophica bacterium]|nr:diacylglycerol kinase family protein [Candidatus Omnitrophota bacterium]